MQPPPDDLLVRYDGFLFDLDGVLYRGSDAVRGAVDAVRAVRAAARPVVFVTNNATRTPDEVASFLRQLGFDATPEEVVTSAIATAAMLSSRAGTSAFVIGERGLREALTSAGIDVVNGDPEHAHVVGGGLGPNVTYAKAKRGAPPVPPGPEPVRANPGRPFPQTDGLWPGAGALLASVEAATGVSPTVVGKPHP